MAELDTKGRLTRNEVADFLREFANELDDRAVSERLRDDPRAIDEDDRGRSEVADREGRTDRHGDHAATYDEADADDPPNAGATGDATERTDPADDARRVTLVIGGDSATVTVPEVVEFDVRVNSRSPMLSSGVTQEVDFDMSWEIEDVDERDRSIDVV